MSAATWEQTALRCGHCGRFTDGPDGYTPWGPGMTEPPDPIVLCAACAAKQFRLYLSDLRERGIPLASLRPAWHSSGAWYLAVAVVRGERKHGKPPPIRHMRARTELDAPRAWFCRRCGQPERHPSHQRAERARTHALPCSFERAVERSLRSARVREWCSCGWATPWLDCGEKYQQDIYPQWNEHGGINGSTYAQWLIAEHVSGAVPR